MRCENDNKIVMSCDVCVNMKRFRGENKKLNEKSIYIFTSSIIQYMKEKERRQKKKKDFSDLFEYCMYIQH